jgi:hypothetical protein|nr:MAG TPA: Protein of unknown function (DUF669) [Caudoviricetes sp.]
MDNNFNNYNQNGFNQASQNDGAMGWDDTITAEAKEYTLLPVGTYQFIIKDNFVRSKTSGNGKLPVCNKADITLTINYEGKEVKVTTSLILHKSLEWKISQFFECIGMKQKGVPFRPDWNGIIGKTGTVKISHREYNDAIYNNVKEFVINDNVPAPSQPQAWGNNSWK